MTEDELISLSLSHPTLCQFHWPILTQWGLIETDSLYFLKAYSHSLFILVTPLVKVDYKSREGRVEIKKEKSLIQCLASTEALP